MTEKLPDYETKSDGHITPQMRQDIAWKLYYSSRQSYISTGSKDDHEVALWWLGRYLLVGGEIRREDLTK